MADMRDASDPYVRFARQRGLTICDTQQLTLSRRRAGKGFSFVDEDGAAADAETKARLKALVVPPAWEDVKFASDPSFHIQAVGRDGSGRLQYRYHDDWEWVRNQVKALRLLRFGRALPALRRSVKRDLARKGRSRRAVVSAAVRLIDKAAMRPGNEAYARDGTRGATTLKAKDMTVRDGGVIQLDYRGKGGQQNSVTVKDRLLAQRLKALRRQTSSSAFGQGTKRKRGPRSSTNEGNRRLFQLPTDAPGGGTSLSSTHLNGYLQLVTGEAISAKDFRTFHASALALELLVDAAEAGRSGNRAKVDTAKQVAAALRNTPTVARNSYIHPPLFEAFDCGQLDASLLRGPFRKGLDPKETGLMRFLERKMK